MFIFERNGPQREPGFFIPPAAGKELTTKKNMKKKTAWVWLNEKVSVLSVFDIGTDGCASYHPEFPKGQL